jgi:hypothetical protein
LRRQLAIINVLMHQLMRIEAEEGEIKMTHISGTNIIDGKEMSFENVTTRHVTPYEIKLKLMDSLARHEKNYAALLRQREELLVTCVMIMRRFGVQWDPTAGRMIAEAIQKGSSAINALPDLRPGLPITINESAPEELLVVPDQLKENELPKKKFCEEHEW